MLDVALAEFAEKGFEKASFNRIIDRAGLSKGAVYYYFDDKEDLFATVLKQVLRIFKASLGGIGPVSTPEEFWDEFRDYLFRGLKYKAGNPAFVRLGMAMIRAAGKNKSSLAVKFVYREFMTQLEEIFNQGQKVGAVRDDMPPDLLVGMIFSASEALQEWFLHRYDNGEFDPAAIDFDQGMKFVMGLYRRILTPGDEPPLESVIGCVDHREV